jgi:hypothetical protein
MSSLIDIYQSKLKKLNQKIEYNFGTLSKKTEEKLSEINDNLKESQKLLKNLELEVSGESQQSNSYLILKIYKNSYNEYSKKYKVEKEKFENSLKEVSLGINSDINLKQNLKNDEIAYNSFNKLENVRRISIEMEGLGQDVMRDMNSQSETMKGINSKIGDVSNDLNTSNALLTEMNKIQRRNKTIVYLYGAFLFFVFLVIAFFRIYPKFKSGNNNNNAEPLNIQNKSNITSFFKY